MIERSEEDGLAGRLPISLGGERVVLRTLSIDESEDWLGKCGAAIAGFDIPVGLDGSESFDAIARTPSRTMLDLVVAYDVDGVLPEIAELRKRFRQRELYETLRAMVTAEAPFVTDLRSAVEAFGPTLRSAIGTAIAALAERFAAPAQPTNGPSLTGDSIPALSVVGSPSNASPSSGGTVRSESRANGGRRRSSTS